MEQQPPPTPRPHEYDPSATQIHASIAPFVCIFVAVVVLGMAAVAVGRVCSGKRKTSGSCYQGKYDMERWAESKCSSCIEGRIHVNSPSMNTSSEKDVEHSGTVVGTPTPTNQSPSSRSWSANRWSWRVLVFFFFLAGFHSTLILSVSWFFFVLLITWCPSLYCLRFRFLILARNQIMIINQASKLFNYQGWGPKRSSWVLLHIFKFIIEFLQQTFWFFFLLYLCLNWWVLAMGYVII